MLAPEDYMRRALELAALGLYTTTPNPRVGCVIVDAHGEIIGEGFTQPVGQNHAEIQALQDAAARSKSVAGATAFVTLEPCSHFGRTPPCCDALITAGIARVVAAMQDPNPQVSGRGFERLAAAGIAVTTGLLADEAAALNRGFIKRMQHGTPLLRLKIAASLDGKTALANGESKWITGEASRADAHHWRARSCAILTGIGTVLADDPQLNVRAVATTRQPVKVIVDTRLETPFDAALLREGKTLIATLVTDVARHAPYLQDNAEVLVLPEKAGHIDLPALMQELGRRGFNEVLTETGPRLNSALLSSGCVDELLIYMAPMLLGEGAQSMLPLPELSSLSKATHLSIEEVVTLDADLRIRAHLTSAP